MQLSQIPYPKYRFEDAVAETLQVADWVSTWGARGGDGAAAETTSLYMFENTESTTNVPLSKECDVVAANLTCVVLVVDNWPQSHSHITITIAIAGRPRRFASVLTSA